MIIVLNCPGCKKRYELDGALAGKKSRCRQCGEIFRIPVPTAGLIPPAPSPPIPSGALAPPQPSWTATPLADRFGGEPATAKSLRSAPSSVREPSSPSKASVRVADTRPTVQPPIARSRPTAESSAFDDDLPPPPRAGYRPARRGSSASLEEDSNLGITAFGWFVLLDALATIGMYLYLGLGQPDPAFAGRVYALVTGITFLTAIGLSLWGGIWLLCLAFREDLMKGVFCLVVPFYAFFFVLHRWHERRGTFALSFAPLVMLAINLSVGWLVASTVKDRLGPPANGPATEGRALAGGESTPGDPGLPAGPNPAPAPSRIVSRSARKADASQVRIAEDLIRREVQLINGFASQLATVHDGFSANRAAHSLRLSSMFARGPFRGSGDIDLGPNEVVALKHRLGADVIGALNQLKAQAARIRTIPGLEGFIRPDAISRIDGLIAEWTLKAGEETMPELVEPPPSSAPFGPRGRFRPGLPGMPGPFPPGMPPMTMSGDVVENMERDYQAVRREYGDRTAAILVTGLPTHGDPPTSDITEAISKRIKELSPEIARSHAVSINDRFATVVAPVNDIQGLASRIDFGTVTVKDDRIEIQLDARWAANVPRKPAQPQAGPPTAPPPSQPRSDEPEVPAGADAITRSMIELKSSDPGKRKRAVERLQRSAPDGRVDQVVEALIPLLEDDDGFFVSDVVKTLAVWKSPEAMAALIGRMRENHHFFRSEAIKALGKYRDLRAAEAIVTVIKEDGFAVEEALKSMGEVAEPALFPVLRSPDSGLRGHACRILAEIGGKETLREMQSLPPDPDFGVRVAAQDAGRKIISRVGPLPRPARGKTGTSPAPSAPR